MNYFIEFAKNEPVGFGVFVFLALCLISVVMLLVKVDATCLPVSPYFYGKVKPPKPRPLIIKHKPITDFNEMCESCFGAMISKMPMRVICDLEEVERLRMLGCRHNSKSATPPPPPTTEYVGRPL